MLPEPKGTGTVGKALSVLDDVAAFERPIRFSEILATSSFPKGSLYRFLQNLTNEGMLSYDPKQQTYSLGRSIGASCTCCMGAVVDGPGGKALSGRLERENWRDDPSGPTRQRTCSLR